MKLINLKKKYRKIIREIKEFEKSLETFTDSEVRIANFNLQKQYLQTKLLKTLISQSFALTRESSRRTLGLKHYDVQLLGGLVLNNNNIAEIKTGEGKTLIATLPAVFNSTISNNVHIVTVNDYLTIRDYSTMNKVYRFLGLKTGLIQNKMSTEERQINYNCNITYVPNSTLAFDFLRDTTALNISELVSYPPHFNYCIIDEVDSILIDEAQTPVILANTEPGILKYYIIASEITNYLELNKHYTVNEKEKSVVLTELGHIQIEKILKINSLYNQNKSWISYIINSLKATSLYFNNVHYIIQSNRIIIVDEFTGRTMSERRWGNGIHQAIEAKEQLPISLPTKTQASVTYQTYFLMYSKVSGMTGTGKTSEIEFQNIFNLSVEIIPTFRPNKRIDLPDLIYKDQFSKWNAIAKFCKKLNKKGQPILIMTTSVAKSEMLSQLLEEYNLTYQLLNAKFENSKKEAIIIAKAGISNTITISTNMAGRGTDIILGGNITIQVKKKVYNLLTYLNTFSFFSIFQNSILKYSPVSKLTYNSQKIISILETIIKNSKFLNLSFLQIIEILQIQTSKNLILYQKMIRRLVFKLESFAKKSHLQKSQIVKNLGGLYIIGTERNDSRRIDNQLRGRCGRQGDPGISRFYISLDDNLLRLFADTKIQTVFRQISPNSPLESNFISKNLDLAQEQIEELAFEKRKDLFKYEQVEKNFKEMIYIERYTNLINKSSYIRKNFFAYIEQLISEFFELSEQNLINSTDLCLVLDFLWEGNCNFKNFELKQINWKEIQSYFYSEGWLSYQLQINNFDVLNIALYEIVEKDLSLYNLDLSWQESLSSFQRIREATVWRNYDGQMPSRAYNIDLKLLFFYFMETCFYSTIFELYTMKIKIT